MFEEAIYENYGFRMERQESVGGFAAFMFNNCLFSIIPLQEINEEELRERQQMSQFLTEQGDKYVSTFVMSKKETYLSQAGDKVFLLLANPVLEEPRDYQLGKKLARFHIRGRLYPHQVKSCSRIGKWKEMWEQRIDGIETVWREKLQSHPGNEFERLFVESFPYFMALGENAIQYLVDTEIDDQPGAVDYGTVCHERFLKNSWRGRVLVRNPFDWVFDHGTRDVAEWVRDHYLEHPHTYQPALRQFISDYQNTSAFTGFSARLLYSRLLLPIHYYETIENYFIAQPESRQKELEESLETIINNTRLYERFLQSFYEAAEIPAKKLRLPQLDWL
ncbi:spore coat putative kinase YutH [Peribacillus deserti]|uniref:Spore coat protein YutH n=1 Tax=Peribacillus deserti TaxID=673318 RepID=A0A2N5M7P2_9BACI|nr:spore coat protein YutH [Peribacillus deserti]PLT30313.1 spore coat protein YutH [Peribacillus deserti]